MWTVLLILAVAWVVLAIIGFVFKGLLWLALIGTLGSTAHYCFVRSYKYIDVSLAEPIVPVRLIWSAAIGYFAFAETPDWGLWVGGAMIVVATTYIAHHEATQKKRSAAAAPA